MKTPVEIITSGALLLKRGEDTIVRGVRDVIFRFRDDEATFSYFDHDHDHGALVADVGPSGCKNGLTSRKQYDAIELRYIVRPEGPDMVSVVFTVAERQGA